MVDLYDASHSVSWDEVSHDTLTRRADLLSLPPETSYAEALASSYSARFTASMARLYRLARPRLATSKQTLGLLLKVWRDRPEKLRLPVNVRMPDPDDPGAYDALEVLCTKKGWESSYQASLTKDVLSDPALSSKKRLTELLAAEKEASTLRKRAFEFSQSDESTYLDAKRYKDMVESWLDLGGAVHNAERELVSRSTAQEQAAYWTQRQTQIFSRISQQYKGMGPQYEVLVSSLTNTILRLEKAEFTSPDGNPAPQLEVKEFVLLQQLITSQVNQLQRYTEAQKTEVIKTEVNAAMLKVLEIVEHAVAPDYPQLWNRIVTDVKTAVMTAAGDIIEQENTPRLAVPSALETDFEFEIPEDEELVPVSSQSSQSSKSSS